jgi:DNA invertase Pin-like site-specific DNA recombinase
MNFAYKRVSTKTQNLDRQLHGLEFDREFVEKISGKDTNRPELQALLGVLREDDEVHVHELSRLARNTKDLLNVVEEVLNSGASIHFHKENLFFLAGEKHMPIQDLMLSLLGSIAQFERDLLLERQREGISLAKQRGVYKGKQSKFSDDDIADIKEQFRHAKNKSKLAKKLGISRGYLYQLVA